jgi:MFS family permease
MALLHSAGAVGMILGPIAAALLDMMLRGWSVPARSATFMALAGALHALVTLTLAARCRDLPSDGLPTTSPSYLQESRK